MNEFAPREQPFAGAGEMAARVATFDWAATAVGPPSQWSKSLRTIVSVILNSRHPMFLFWGPQLVQFYNDGYRPSLGSDRHPAALGAEGRVFWAEIWPIIGPQIEAVMERGESTWNEDHFVPILRNGRVEEVYWTYGYSPVTDDDGRVGGVLVVVQEQTVRVLTARRLRMLRDLASGASSNPSELGALTTALDVLASNRLDIPWAALYALSDDGATARRIANAETQHERLSLSEHSLEPGSPLRQLVNLGEPTLVDDASPFMSLAAEPAVQGAPPRACALPVRRAAADDPYLILVAGLSTTLPFDADYRDFLSMVAAHLAAAITSARARVQIQEAHSRLELALAREQEARLRAERANHSKDEFLTTLSHELRTPVNTILGWSELIVEGGLEPAEARQGLLTIRRNARAQVQLIEDLLDMSRIVAGKVRLHMRPLILADVVETAVNSVRPAADAKGVDIIIGTACDGAAAGDSAVLQQVFWNLIGNAIKFTPRGGRVEIAVVEAGGHTLVSVSDTGEGIDPEFLPYVFDRFMQGDSTPTRVHGGLGIGLSIVKQLVEAHGGTVEAASPGKQKGSRFTVSLPVNRAS